jgi:hypothetical protein
VVPEEPDPPAPEPVVTAVVPVELAPVAGPVVVAPSVVVVAPVIAAPPALSGENKSECSLLLHPTTSDATSAHHAHEARRGNMSSLQTNRTA